MNTGPRSATLNLPFLRARFYPPEVRFSKSGSQQIDSAVQSVRGYVPSSRQALYYGGLALVAAFGVVEWPVAAAIGVGTALAGKSRDSAENSGSADGSGSRTGKGGKNATASE